MFLLREQQIQIFMFNENINASIKQKLLFQNINNKRKDKRISLVEELKSLLECERGAIYKRMNGEISLRLDELYKISSHFNISLDSIFQEHNDFVNFKYDLIDRPLNDANEFFQYAIEVFDSIRNSPNNKFIYQSKNLPFMHYFNYPILFQLKMLVWQNTSLAVNSKVNNFRITMKPFKDSEITFMGELARTYYKHPIVEIWSSNILSNLYKQVKFFVLANIITDLNFIENFCTNAQLLINHLELITSQGFKKRPGKNESDGMIKVYINEMELGSPMAYYESDAEEKCFLIHDSPNFIYSQNAGFCNYSAALLKKTIQYSTCISDENTKERIKFFQKTQRDFEKFKSEIKQIFSYAQL